MFAKIKRYFDKKKYGIEFLVVITGQKCTLRCRDCSNFSPYFSSTFDFYDMRQIIQDIETILKHVKYIRCIQLQGGDFFLHKDIQMLLQYIHDTRAIKQCTIAHNCILKPKDDVVGILQHPKFTLRLSSYGLVNELNEHEITTYCREHGINFIYYSFSNANGTWSKLGGVFQPRAGEEQTRKNYRQCGFKHCLTLENGTISRCSRATIAHYIQKFTPKEEDFVNVRENFSIKRLQEYIENALTQKGIVEACYYCNGTGGGGDTSRRTTFTNRIQGN